MISISFRELSVFILWAQSSNIGGSSEVFFHFLQNSVFLRFLLSLIWGFPIVWGWFLTFKCLQLKPIIICSWASIEPSTERSHEPQYPTKRMNWGEELMYTWCMTAFPPGLLFQPHLTSAFGSAWNCYMGFQRAQWLISWWYCPLRLGGNFTLNSDKPITVCLLSSK